jgi:hypothetical protein
MTMRDMKSLPDRDPARAKLAAAIALEAGAARDLQVAEQASALATSRYYEAQSALDELRKEQHAPSGALAAEFISSVGSGNPCNVAVLERSSVESRAKMTAAENDVNVWQQTREECDLAARQKEDAVAESKERLERAARVVICSADNTAKLVDDLSVLQAEIIEKRSALRFISGHGCNGELARPLMEQIERVLLHDLSGLGPTDSYRAWERAFETLMTDSDSELPTEIARAV